MAADLEAWFNTRPMSAPTSEMPPPSPTTVAVARALGGAAEVRIVRHRSGLLTFEIEAWTNFEDAGGGAHVQWHTFYPGAATLCDTFERIIELAGLDAASRGLTLGSFEQWPKAEAG